MIKCWWEVFGREDVEEVEHREALGMRALLP
jgi:hypothetical protein